MAGHRYEAHQVWLNGKSSGFRWNRHCGVKPISCWNSPRLLMAALLHESNVARNDPDPVVGHRLVAYDAGLPKSLIRFSTLHARTASAPCPAELRARKPSPMMDLYRKKTFSTRACRW